MKYIEKKIRCGWTVDDCLVRFNCSSKEDLFKLMRKYYSRKTVNGYMKKLEKNSIIRMEKNNQIRENVNVPNLEEKKIQNEQSTVSAKETTETTIIKTEKVNTKKGVVQKIVEFFKRLIK